MKRRLPAVDSMEVTGADTAVAPAVAAEDENATDLDAESLGGGTGSGGLKDDGGTEPPSTGGVVPSVHGGYSPTAMDAYLNSEPPGDDSELADDAELSAVSEPNEENRAQQGRGARKRKANPKYSKDSPSQRQHQSQRMGASADNLIEPMSTPAPPPGQPGHGQYLDRSAAKKKNEPVVFRKGQAAPVTSQTQDQRRQNTRTHHRSIAACASHFGFPESYISARCRREHITQMHRLS